jgi:hypothetical protein
MLVDNKKITLAIFLGLILSCPLLVYGAMNSGNYQIFADGFMYAGDSDLNSANYMMVAGGGEIGMGLSDSANYSLRAGTPAIDREPAIGITVSSDRVDLGVLSSSVTASKTNTIQAFSNSHGGYVLKVYGQTLTANTETITAIGASAQASALGTEQFGINLVANTIPLIGANPTLRSAVLDADYGTVNQFAFANNDTVATSNKPSIDDFTVSYIANIAGGTAAGLYQTTITFALTSNF